MIPEEIGIRMRPSIPEEIRAGMRDLISAELQMPGGQPIQRELQMKICDRTSREALTNRRLRVPAEVQDRQIIRN